MTTVDRGGSSDGPAPRAHAGAVLASGVVEALGGDAPDDDAPDGDAVLTDLVAFARLLRNAGVPVTPDRTATYLRALREVDRADDEFEAFLLEVLAENSVTIPEIGVIRAETPPLVVLTSNRTREVHDALKRRCLYLWLEHPDLAREIAILKARMPELSTELAEQVAQAVQRLRGLDLLKPPGVAETLDWAAALELIGARRLDLESATATLGAVLKYREDADRARDALDALLAS